MGKQIRWESLGGPGRKRGQKSGKGIFWRRLGRMVPLALLLLLLWGYVLPYQAAVQIDKSLAVWTHDHVGWQLVREGGGAYAREYRISWTAAADKTPSIEARVSMRIRPVGWPTERGRQWGWATFSLSLDTQSPIQLTRWPNTPWHVSGLIGWLGTLDMHLPNTAPESGSGRLTYDPRSGRWQGVLDLPAWVLTTPTYIWRFGRSNIDLDIRPVSDDLSGGSRAAIWDGLLGEVGVDIRRLGWVGPKDRVLVDGLQLRLRQSVRQQGDLRDLVGSMSVAAVRQQGETLGSAQMTFGISDADPAVLRRLISLARRIAALGDAPSVRAAPDSVLAALEQGYANEALTELLIALRRAEVHLDALRYQGTHGGISATGMAFGPRSSIHSMNPGGAVSERSWHAQLAVVMDDGWLAQWPTAVVRRWSPWLHHRQDRWVGSFEYGINGWRIPTHPVDISTFRPQD